MMFGMRLGEVLEISSYGLSWALIELGVATTFVSGYISKTFVQLSQLFDNIDRLSSGMMAIGVLLTLLSVCNAVLFGIKNFRAQLFALYLVVGFLLLQIVIGGVSFSYKGIITREVSTNFSSLEYSWMELSNSSKIAIQNRFHCCGFDTSEFERGGRHVNCSHSELPSCRHVLSDLVKSKLTVLGTVGFVISLLILAGAAFTIFVHYAAESNRADQQSARLLMSSTYGDDEEEEEDEDNLSEPPPRKSIELQVIRNNVEERERENEDSDMVEIELAT